MIALGQYEFNENDKILAFLIQIIKYHHKLKS